MTKFGMLIKFSAKPGSRDALAAHLSSLVPIAEAEPGTETYIVSVSPAEPDTVWLLESYLSPEALELHNANPAIVAAKPLTGSFLAGASEAFAHVPVAGKGLL